MFNPDPRPEKREPKKPKPIPKFSKKRLAEMAKGAIIKKQYSIPRQSDKGKKRQSKFKPLRDKFMKENPICQYPSCKAESQHLHHAYGKIGEDLFRGFRALCALHHFEVELNPEHAKEIGLSKSRLNKRS